MLMDTIANQSNLRNWKSEHRILFSFGTLCLVLLLDEGIISLFVILTMAAISIGKGKIKGTVYLRILGVPIVFILCSTIALLWIEPWTTVLTIMGKALAAASALLFLALHTPMSEVFYVLQKWHCPELFVELMFLIYRFIFVLLEVYLQMYYAAKARNGYGTLTRSFKTFGQIGSNLLLVSIKKAKGYYQAMEARAYVGTFHLWEDVEEKKSIVGGMIGYWCLLILLKGGIFYYVR